MNSIDCVLERSVESDLERVVEPLASYICTTERPKTALLSALAALVREVEATNRAANGHFLTLRGNH